ncbi:sugar-binding protein [Paenibacillus flagellatus]|uniref:Carbohydrate-binding domain-containing protein n=1 Tax=Paenibacillus flagellatus TaxID=2211139 RepID=A0A2V5KKZ8_9BACL|nr:sugar-binding protein [Paenibacillus flagellatus]PYI55550.1 hypothetical protein DLM86_07400 [Paenibacillus flagellatus]
MGRTSKWASLLLVFAVMFASASLIVAPPNRAYADTPTRTIAIGGFESDAEGWKLSLGAEFPGAKGELVRDSAAPHSGAYSGKLSGDFQGGGNYVSASRSIASHDAQSLSFWVKTSDVGRLGLRLIDSTGQTHQQRVALQPTSDWQRITISKFNGGTQYSHWGGANDGVWHGPAGQISFLLDRSSLTGGKLAGSVQFDDVELTVPMPALEIEQVKLGNVFEENEPVSFRVLTSGDSVTSSVYDYWGNRVAERTDPVEGGSRTVLLPALKPGYYTVSMNASRAGSPIKQAETTLAVLPPYDWSQAPDSPFGMATHFGQAWSPELIPLLQKAGVKSIRDEMYWGTVEPQKGVYTFPDKLERYMNELQSHRIKPFLIFSYTNPHYDQNSTPYTDEGRQGFARYGRAVVQHYGSSLDWVEVYNEFNIAFGDRGDGPADSKPEYYFKLLKETYQTIKAHDPNVTVVGAATAGIPWSWLEEVFRLGGLPYMDAVSIHPYRYPGAPESLAGDLVNLQELIKRYNNGQPKPIWISEIGWPTQLDARGVTESTQARYTVRSHVIALSEGVEKLFWYDFMNDGLTDTHNEHNFGIVRNPGDAKGKYAPKPAYVAYATMTRQLTGSSFVHKEQIGETIRSYLFGGANGHTRVLWSTEPKQVRVKTDDPITVTDLVGVADTFHPLHGYVYLTLTESPIYLRGSVTSIEEGSKFSLTSSPTPAGMPLSIGLTADNTEPPRGRIQAALDMEGRSYPLDVMPGKTETLSVSLPAVGAPQSKTATGYIVSKGKKVGMLQTEIRIVDPVRLQVKHVLKNGVDTVTVSVYNDLNVPFRLDRIDWKIGSASGVLDADQVVPAGSGVGVDVPVPALPANQAYPLSLTLHSPDANPVAYSGKLRLIGLSDMKPFARKSIVVDGGLDDLSGVPSVSLTGEGTVKIKEYAGEADLSGEIWGTSDEQHLYLSARIRDDVFSQNDAGDGIWQGDSIQFAVSPGTPGESRDWYEYGIALTGSGPQLYRWIAAQGLPTGPVANAHLRIVRDEAAKETVYELALPWTELKPAHMNDGMLAFSILVNDNDGQGRKGWIEWGAGIGGSKDNGLFKPIRLLPQP